MSQLKTPIFRVWFCLLACCISFSASARPDEPIRVPFNASAGHGDWLYLTVGFTNGGNLLFAVDTGSPVTILDRSLEGSLGKKLGSVKNIFPLSGATIKSGLYAAPPLFVGQFRLKTGRYLVCEDLASRFKTAIPGQTIAGILGLDCFDQSCVRLDFVTHQLSFLEVDSTPHPDWGSAFPLTLSKGLFPWLRLRNEQADVRLDFGGNKNLLLKLDTGYPGDGLLASDPLATAMRASIPKFHVGKLPPTKGFAVPFETFAFGGQTYTNVVLANAGRNLLGLSLLARNQVTIDFPRRVLYLKRIQD